MSIGLVVVMQTFSQICPVNVSFNRNMIELNYCRVGKLEVSVCPVHRLQQVGQVTWNDPTSQIICYMVVLENISFGFLAQLNVYLLQLYVMI